MLKIRPAFGTTKAQFGFILLQGWAGLTKKRVQIVGETPKKYRIRALEDTRLAGRSRYVLKGDETLVPKHAVVTEESLR